MFQMPRLVCSLIWHSNGCSVSPPKPAPTASTAQVSAPVNAILREARYSQAEVPKPGSPELNWAMRFCFSAG